MYNAPRAATVTAKTDCRLWGLDRLTFKVCARPAAGGLAGWRHVPPDTGLADRGCNVRALR